jgi:hypothetical protein
VSCLFLEGSPHPLARLAKGENTDGPRQGLLICKNVKMLPTGSRLKSLLSALELSLQGIQSVQKSKGELNWEQVFDFEGFNAQQPSDLAEKIAISLLDL